jgi:hypothetical protein
VGEQGVIRLPLLADGGEAFRAHLTAAERTGAMKGKNFGVVGKRQEPVMHAAVQHRGELLRRMGRRRVGPAHIVYEERVSRKDFGGPIRCAAIVHQNANALECVPWSVEERRQHWPN